MSRFSPQRVRTGTQPSDLAAALQGAVSGYQGQRDRQQADLSREFAQNLQRGQALRQGITLDTPPEPETFGSAFAKAYRPAPEVPPTPAGPPVAGGYDPNVKDFQRIDPVTKAPVLPTMRSGGATYDPNLDIQRETAGVLAGGRAKLGLGREERDLYRKEFGPTVVERGGTMAAAGDLPTARTYMAKPEDPNEALVIVDDGSGPRYVPRSQAIGMSPGKATAAGGGGADSSDLFRLRTDYRMQPRVRTAQTIAASLNRIQNTQDTAVGDLSLIFAYMKMLDPESVVRETEFANAQNAAGVPDQIRNLYNRVVSGERLNPNQRAQFRSQAIDLARGAQAQLDAINREYEGLARSLNIDPQMVLSNPFTQTETRPLGGVNSPPQGRVNVRQFAPPGMP